MSGEINKRAKKRRTTKKRKSIFLSLLLYLLFFSVIFIIGATISYRYITSADKLTINEITKKIESGNSVEIDIPFNSSTDDIAKILKESDIIK